MKKLVVSIKLLFFIYLEIRFDIQMFSFNDVFFEKGIKIC